MPIFGQALFGGSPFIRWTVGPLVIAFLLGMTFVITDWNLKVALMIAGFYALGIPLVIGLFIPRYGRVAFRAVASLVFLVFSVCLFLELREHNWRFVGSKSPGDPSPVSMLRGFIIVGLPSLIFAIRGRFTWRNEENGEQA